MLWGMANRCAGCRALRRRVAELEARVRELENLLRRYAGNSSMPPSANPPGAPKPVIKEPTGRPPGGQSGHEACRRVRLPPERVGRIIDHFPKACRACGQALPRQRSPHDPEPRWHQIAELPEVIAEVTEHRGHIRTCPACGTPTAAVIPAAIRAHAFGPRLTATVAYLSGVMQGSRRAVAEVVQSVFAVPLALGTVCRREQETAAALADAHSQALTAVQSAPAKQVDETGWKKAGRPCWLWAAACRRVTAFIIHERRGIVGLQALLGRWPRGIIGTDRWKAYDRLPRHHRQVCWAHLLRDFRALAERPGSAGKLGGRLLLFAEDFFHWWRRIRDGTLRRSSLRTYLQQQRAWFRATLEDGLRSGCRATEAFCRDLLRLEPALWTFARHRGVDPTNNRVERALRPAVVWRKKSFGCVSDAGCRFTERMLTVVATLRQRGLNLIDYLTSAIEAHRAGLPGPKLLTNG